MLKLAALTSGCTHVQSSGLCGTLQSFMCILYPSGTCLHIHPPSNEIWVGMNNCVARAVRLEFKYSLDTWMQVNCKICYISTLYAIPHVLALNWPLAPAGNVCFFVGSMVHIGLVSVKSVLLVHWNQVNLSVAFSSIWMQNVNIGNHGKLRQRRLLPSFPP